MKVGIDGATLLGQLPQLDQLLTGYQVPVVYQKYCYVCSVLLHTNKKRRDKYWQLVRFQIFKVGEETPIFNGFKALAAKAL
jgi:hypothetical protein